jgi:calmodulin
VSDLTQQEQVMAGKADPYADIEFDEINEVTGLEIDEVKCLKNCFDLFDSKKVQFLSADDLDEILRAMGFRPSPEELLDILKEIDEDGSGEIEFGEFCQLCAKFLVEDPDIETMKRELKDAFRLYDKAGEGFITMDTLRELISELLAPLSAEELDGIIEELDEDGSGTMDFDEFCEMMMSAPEK